MLNTPNEWHNEEDTDNNLDLEDDILSLEDIVDEPNAFSDNKNYNDEDVNSEDFDESDSSEDYNDDNQFNEDDNDDSEEYDDNENNHENNDGNLKKYLIIGSSILLVFLLLVGGIFGFTKINKKNSNKDTTAIETSVNEENDQNIEVSENENNTNQEETVEISDNQNGEGEEVSIDVEVEDNKTETTQENKENKLADSESELKIEVEDEPQSTFTDKPKDNTVTVSIGDVGRKNPFAPAGHVGTINPNAIAKSDNDGLDFEVIEPPEIGEERLDIAKLLNTKVTGILYDKVKPSAIINIEGIDQLVKQGDFLSGFEIISITKNKVVIKSDNNVYRASVGQPLNAEKITNLVEISNLETKFRGSLK